METTFAYTSQQLADVLARTTGRPFLVDDRQVLSAAHRNGYATNDRGIYTLTQSGRDYLSTGDYTPLPMTGAALSLLREVVKRGTVERRKDAAAWVFLDVHRAVVPSKPVSGLTDPWQADTSHPLVKEIAKELAEEQARKRDDLFRVALPSAWTSEAEWDKDYKRAQGAGYTPCLSGDALHSTFYYKRGLASIPRWVANEQQELEYRVRIGDTEMRDFNKIERGDRDFF